MAIHICVTCDEEGCDVAQSVGFDSPSETYGSLLEYLEQNGWLVTGEPVPGVNGMNLGTTFSCPKHREVPDSLPEG